MLLDDPPHVAAARALPTLSYPAELPISARREEIIASLSRSRVLILCGETGSGKTTQLPKCLLEAGVVRSGMIGHTQPRRIAARAVAARLTAELSDAPPHYVGHKVRFNDSSSPDTVIKVMTDGILLAEARGDPNLSRYDAIIIDEAHERSLNIDLLMGFLRDLLTRRADLTVVITSATIEPKRFSAYFHDAPVIEVSGRSYPVEVRYRPLESDTDDRFDVGLIDGIVSALTELTQEPGDIGRGDVLVFLPGERDIREAAEAIEQRFGEALAILPLYSRLAWSEQQRVFDTRGPRRVVLATNVAETSLTVPGIRTVIDSGLARLARYSARSKLLRLPIEPISQASAWQRTGRCGRMGAGVCIRLYAEDDFLLRPEFTPPEVLRTNLASVILQMETLKLGSPTNFPFLDPPDTRLINDGYRLLQELQAVDEAQAITAVGRTIARLPVDPRMGRMLLEARSEGCLAELSRLVAVLSIQDPRERPQDRQAAADAAHAEGADAKSDFVTLLSLRQRYQEARDTKSKSALRRWCQQAFLSAARMREWEELETQLHSLIRELGWVLNSKAASVDAIHRALLAGLLGNVGEKTERSDFVGARGRRFVIAPGTPVRKSAPRWLMAAQMVETERVYARLVASIDPLWVETLAAHLVKREYTEPEWDEHRGVVSCRQSVTLYGLQLIAGRRVNYGQVAPQEAREIFVREALVHRRCRLKAAFVEHNLALKRALWAEEAALRRHVVLVDEIAEAARYLALIPSEVHSLATFERWRKQQERIDPTVLQLSLAQLRQADAPAVSADQYPKHLSLAGNHLPIRYVFDPQSPQDGATVQVPEPLVPKLTVGELEWGIPAWLPDKVTALIRGLPKALRRQLVPAPDVAAHCLQELQSKRHLGLLAALSEILTKRGGQAVSESVLAAVEIEPWLSLNVRVLDAQGAGLIEGRLLNKLQRWCRARTVGAVPVSASQDPWSRAEIRQFDFGVLPTTVRIERQGVQIDMHPTLRDERTHVSLSLVADDTQAVLVTRLGLTRLLAIQLEPTVRQAQKLIAARRSLMLLHQPVGLARELVEDIAFRAVERDCLGAAGELPRDTQAFQAAAERARPILVASAERLSVLIESILTERHALRAELARIPKGVPAAWIEDVTAQADALVFAGFVRATPDPWLDCLPRYFKAIRRRLQKLGDARTTTVVSQNAFIECRHQIHRLSRLEWPQGYPPSELTELRWVLEEWGVQLFAQELKTRMPVSEKRVREAIQALDARSPRQ
jgi:ATP-dependent helicase HrpA